MSDTTASGLFASLRQLLSTLLETAQIRLQLLGSELESEKRRLFDGIMLGLFALICLLLGLMLLCSIVVAYFWDSYRLTTLWVLVFVFGVVGVSLLTYARGRLRNALGMFYLSVSELQQDRDLLHPDRRHD